MKIGQDTIAAVGYDRNLPADDPGSLIDVEVPRPEVRPHDLLVEVRAVSVNPVDVKQRSGSDPRGTTRILGFDAAGIVREAGPAVTLFAPGDEVYYAAPSTGRGRMRPCTPSTSGSWDASRAPCRSPRPRLFR